MFEYVLLKQSKSDCIERLFYYQSTEKCRNTVILGCRGWQKLKRQLVFSGIHIADSSTHQLKNLTLSKISKFPIKPSQIPISPPQPLYRAPYRQNPLKSMLSAILPSKNQNHFYPNSTSKINNILNT